MSNAEKSNTHLETFSFSIQTFRLLIPQSGNLDATFITLGSPLILKIQLVIQNAFPGLHSITFEFVIYNPI